MQTGNLSEGSRSYHEEADVYERFSQAEDAPEKVLGFLRTVVEGGAVLDVGCGTGKYIVPLASLAEAYFGLDISANQLKIARQKISGLGNVRLICSSAESIDLPDDAVDIAVSTWMLGTILDERRRCDALTEVERVTRDGGHIYLVENDIGGEFEVVRGRFPDTRRTLAYNDWLGKQGFRPASRFRTRFGFHTTDEAQRTFSAIWGPQVGERVQRPDLEHRVVIYQKRMD